MECSYIFSVYSTCLKAHSCHRPYAHQDAPVKTRGASAFVSDALTGAFSEPEFGPSELRTADHARWIPQGKCIPRSGSKTPESLQGSSIKAGQNWPYTGPRILPERSDVPGYRGILPRNWHTRPRCARHRADSCP
jgi:hypothetical protein